MWDGNNLVYINPSLSEYLLTGFTAYYGLGIFESNQNGTKYRYQRNAHGDTTALLNQSGDIVRCYIYEDAFGTSTYSADDTNPFRYAGQYYDRESQSYYLRARYYLPRYGRFSQQDTHWNTGNMLYGDNPVTLNGRQIPNYSAISQGLNLYTYCADNPVRYLDSDGEFVIAISSMLVAKVILGAIGIYASAKIGIGIGTEIAKQRKSETGKTAVLSENTSNKDIDDNKKHHIFNGSRGSRDNHAPIWKKFGVDPNGGNGWEKLLPILEEVIKTGTVRPAENDSNKGMTYTKKFIEHGVEIIVRVFEHPDGSVTISDAWGNVLQ